MNKIVWVIVRQEQEDELDFIDSFEISIRMGVGEVVGTTASGDLYIKYSFAFDDEIDKKFYYNGIFNPSDVFESKEEAYCSIMGKGKLSR